MPSVERLRDLLVRSIESACAVLLRVLPKVTPGLGGGYHWVTCGACDAGWQIADYAESVG